MFYYWQNKKLKLTSFEMGFLVGFIGGFFLRGFTKKNPTGFFGYVPGCLNPGFSNPQRVYFEDLLDSQPASELI